MFRWFCIYTYICVPLWKSILQEIHFLPPDVAYTTDILSVVSARDMFHKTLVKPTQSQMSLVVSDIVLKIKFAIKRYETVLYTFNIWYLNEINENSD